MSSWKDHMTHHLRISMAFTLCLWAASATAQATDAPPSDSGHSAPQQDSQNSMPSGNTKPPTGKDAVKPPSVSYSVEPDLNREARQQHFQGNVQVYMWVDTDGKPSHVRIVHGPGGAIDDAVLEAVHQYRFKPALQHGKPVKVDLYIDVNFP